MTAAKNTRSLEDRLQRVEDQLAIYQIISSYGPAADSCSMANIEKHWVPDCTYVMTDFGEAKGYAGLKAMFDAPFHQGLVKDGCAHIASLPHVVVDGDKAAATHYAQVFTQCGDEEKNFSCVRVSVHRWEFSRLAQGWKMVHRTTSLIDGNAAARELLERTMQGPNQGPDTA